MQTKLIRKWIILLQEQHVSEGLQKRKVCHQSQCVFEFPQQRKIHCTSKQVHQVLV